MVAFSSSLMAQTGGIKGVILDEKGQPMAGAAVVVPGTQKYAITENDGTFSIPAVQVWAARENEKAANAKIDNNFFITI